MKYKLIVFRDNKKAQTIRTNKIRRFRSKLSLVKNARSNVFHLVVDYGNGFINEGVYFTKKEVSFALDAFVEKSLINYLHGGL